MKRFRDLKKEARTALKGKWGEAALTFFAYLIIVLVVEAGVGIYQATDAEFMHRYQAYLLQGNPAAAWLFNTFLVLLRGDKNLVDNMFKLGFRPYWRSCLGYLLMLIKIFLWTLLLIIPGIIKSFAYAMTPYVLKDNPELSCLEAIERSRLMMKGNKWRLFVLWLSFIGWFFLGLLTLGIGFFWIGPYIYTTMAAFYEDIKSNYVAA